jgi:HTH-type transcriptional regulator, global nitrogen regulator NrpRI
MFAPPDDIEKKTILILKQLSEVQEPLGSRLIARRLQNTGITVNERTIRYHLRLMDARGLTTLVGRRDGRIITSLGIEELKNARVRDKVGLASSRIEVLAFNTTFDPAGRQGLVPVNISFYDADVFPRALKAMAPAFKKRLFVSDLVAVCPGKGRIGGIIVPSEQIALATVCSIVINGVLLKNGIPTNSKFGGILQMRDDKPLRFVELIHYAGSSLDPSEIFIRGRMTSVQSVIERGEGKILANFREFPGPCRELVERLTGSLRTAGIEGVLCIGELSEPVCQVPVDVNKIGMILVGGLNPVASVNEAGLEAENHGMSTVLDYAELASFWSVLEKHGSP